MSMLPATQPVAIAATSDIPQADAPIAAAKADRMVIASLIQKLRLKLFLFIVNYLTKTNTKTNTRFARWINKNIDKPPLVVKPMLHEHFAVVSPS